MSKEQFRIQQINAGHAVEIGEEHLDVNGKTVRTVMYRSKDFVKPEVVENFELLKEGKTNGKHV